MKKPPKLIDCIQIDLPVSLLSCKHDLSLLIYIYRKDVDVYLPISTDSLRPELLKDGECKLGAFDYEISEKSSKHVVFSPTNLSVADCEDVSVAELRKLLQIDD